MQNKIHIFAEISFILQDSPVKVQRHIFSHQKILICCSISLFAKRCSCRHIHNVCCSQHDVWHHKHLH